MRSERGFSLIELIIAMVLVAIMMAVVIPQFFGSKAATRRKEAIAAGSAYRAAVSQFQADHGNRLPAAGAGTAPTATCAAGGGDMTLISGKAAGPKNLLCKPYMRGLPSGVQEGRVGISQDGSNCGTLPTNAGSSPNATGWVSYCSSGIDSNSYVVRVSARKSQTSPWEAVCATGSKVGAGDTPC
ncbi:MAG: hypothetical protein JWN72_171 [Thermoleophilia bacterium]|nr:hypothetical protein [Thermoleophilia bacterium]